MATVAEVDLLKRQFLAALNHEVRTPLSGIMGMTNLLEQTRLSPEQQEYVALTKACVEELYQVLSSTLEFTALAAGETKLEYSDFPLQETIEAVAAHWLLKARQKGLGFRLRLSDDLPEAARGDEIRVRQILQHLLSNAVKFTQDGEVTLTADIRSRTSEQGRFWLELCVEDTGIGIEESHKKQIFESFEQLESGLARRYPGMGLGLTLAQGLCKLLGGEMTLESEAGRGSKFFVSLPLEVARLEGRPSWENATKRILVVDDNDAARKVARAFLKRDGYQVEVAASGAAGLAAAADGVFDLVLMDLQMPGMDGLETVQRLRKIPGYAATPVIALTANAGEEFRALCQEHGMQDFITKPVESETLLRRVRHLL